MKDMCHYILTCFYHNAILILLHVSIDIRLTTFTVGTSVTSKTFACISVHTISACSAVQTWIAVALEYVYDKQLQFWRLRRIYNATVQIYIPQMWYDNYCCIFNSNVLLFRVCNVWWLDLWIRWLIWSWRESYISYSENTLILTIIECQKMS